MGSTVTWILCIAGAYLVGSLPFGLLLGKTRGIDIREHGSKNVGATNVGRVLGRKLGLLCFVLDTAKGAVPVLASGTLFELLGRRPGTPGLGQLEMWLWLAVAWAAVAGHMCSPFLGFRGGKGVATGFGSMAVMWEVLTFPALGALVVWYGVLRLTRYVSVASMAAAVSLPLGYTLSVLPTDALDRPFPEWLAHVAAAYPPLVVTTLMAALVIWKHRGNIARLRRGEEPKVRGTARRGAIP